MTTENEAFEKWWQSTDYADATKVNLTKSSVAAWGIVLREAWQAAKADSEREIVELEVHINKLRECLADLAGNVGLAFEGAIHWDAHKRARELLNEASAQSLKAHDNEIYERCATVCDEQARDWDSDSVIIDFNYPRYCANKIRALKGE